MLNARLATEDHQILFHAHSYSILDFSLLSIYHRDDGYVRELLYANPFRLEEGGIKPRCLCAMPERFLFPLFHSLHCSDRGPAALECVPLP